MEAPPTPSQSGRPGRSRDEAPARLGEESGRDADRGHEGEEYGAQGQERPLGEQLRPSALSRRAAAAQDPDEPALVQPALAIRAEPGVDHERYAAPMACRSLRAVVALAIMLDSQRLAPPGDSSEVRPGLGYTQTGAVQPGLGPSPRPVRGPASRAVQSCLKKRSAASQPAPGLVLPAFPGTIGNATSAASAACSSAALTASTSALLASISMSLPSTAASSGPSSASSILPARTSSYERCPSSSSAARCWRWRTRRSPSSLARRSECCTSPASRPACLVSVSKTTSALLRRCGCRIPRSRGPAPGRARDRHARARGPAHPRVAPSRWPRLPSGNAAPER